MSTTAEDGRYVLSVAINSGFVEYSVELLITAEDHLVLETDDERAAFLQAALHHPFQNKETYLSDAEQRRFLDIILHSPSNEVETFLTELDHGSANGAISNMVRLTCGRHQDPMRKGCWFISESELDDGAA